MNLKQVYQNIKGKYVQLFGRMFFQDIPSITMMIVCALFLLTLFLILIFRINSSDSLVPLYYNSVYGVTSSVAWYKLYFLPISFTFLLAVNILIAWAFFEKERLITYLMLFVSIIIGLILTIMEYNLTYLIRG
jgi:hypothetical protein